MLGALLGCSRSLKLRKQTPDTEWTVRIHGKDKVRTWYLLHEPERLSFGDSKAKNHFAILSIAEVWTTRDEELAACETFEPSRRNEERKEGILPGFLCHGGEAATLTSNMVPQSGSERLEEQRK